MTTSAWPALSGPTFSCASPTTTKSCSTRSRACSDHRPNGQRRTANPRAQACDAGSLGGLRKGRVDQPLHLRRRLGKLPDTRKQLALCGLSVREIELQGLLQGSFRCLAQRRLVRASELSSDDVLSKGSVPDGGRPEHVQFIG